MAEGCGGQPVLNRIDQHSVSDKFVDNRAGLMERRPAHAERRRSSRSTTL
jgi:hypothetical protein